MTGGQRIYMDNAATSFPKPPAVHAAMMRFATEIGANARGAYAEAREAARLVMQCRERLCQLFGGEKPEHVIFTLNTTDALNLALRGILGTAGRCHVVTTFMEHNSVLRPLNALADRTDIEVTRVEADPQTGLVDPDALRRAIRPDTRLIATIHGSNVGGTIQPIREFGRIARERDIPFLVDAAQTLGHAPINVMDDMIDLLAFAGHKGLLGPLGTGGLYIRPGIEQRMHTVREGGTGSRSDRDVQPDFLPDRFEPGSLNAIGVIGLSEGVQWILDQTVAKLWSHEQDLCRIMIENLSDTAGMPGLTYFGPQGIRNRCGVFSVRLAPGMGFDQPQALSDLLESRYGVLTRSGIHCAPLAHQTFGTLAQGGMTRFSMGPFLTKQDVQYACDALAQICLEHATASV